MVTVIRRKKNDRTMELLLTYGVTRCKHIKERLP